MQIPNKAGEEFKMETICLTHHGVKGMRWGVRRYQYADGTLTPAGKKHRKNLNNFNGLNRTARVMGEKLKYKVNDFRTQTTGKQYVDSYLSKNTEFSRIQTSKEFEKLAFYATYKKSDSDKYMGLFGKNLKTRAENEAKRAEKKAKESGDEIDIKNAKALRTKADNMKVYQLKLKSTDKLKVVSDENAGDIVNKLLKDDEFKKNLTASIHDSKTKMLRPSQQILFKQAENALKKDSNKMNSSDKKAVYKAFNLSLTNHNAQEIAAQNKFYSELKKKGYNALLDYNDKEYSSYHAKKPMIVFDVDSVKLQSVTETNPKVVNILYKKYNAERIVKEIPANTVGLVDKWSTKTIADCRSYVNDRFNDYLR